ncbi:MAG: phospholipase D family protein [Reichenbachiella sp.]
MNHLSSYLQIVTILTLTILISCTEKVDDRFPPITEDYCTQLGKQPAIHMDSVWQKYDSIAQDKTGVYVLEEGDISMTFRAWFTAAAQESIDIQYFIFSADNIGLIAIDYLIKAANRGVKVRLLVDDILVEADAEDLVALDSHPNLSIKIYNPTANIGKTIGKKIGSMVTDFRGFNQRMHNKTFIVDSKIVITGGRNIADEYFDYDHEYNFRDRDVLLMGKATDLVQDSFEGFWNNDLSMAISDIVKVNEDDIKAKIKMEYLNQYACNPDNFWPEVRENIQRVPMFIQLLENQNEIIWTDNLSFVSDIPGKNNGEKGLSGGGTSTDSLIQLIQNAKSSISIQSPYLVTTELSQSLFKAAVDRGVKVKVLTNSLSSTDNLEAFSGYKRERDQLLAIGVELYEFRPDAAIRYEVMTGALQKEMNFTPKFGLHAKSMVIDQSTAVVGTFNLDPRSANLNTECIVIIREDQIAQKLHQIMKNEMLPENAWAVTANSNPDDEAGRAKQFQLWLRGVVPKSIL